ncbi:Ig-like domain-containing protein [Bacillus halotolerans]
MKKICLLVMLCLAAVLPFIFPAQQAAAAGAPYKASISNISTDGGVYGKINYGQGQFWRVKYNITISGTLLDENGAPVPNTPVSFEADTKVGNTTQTAAGTTDENGKFNVPMYLGPAAGYYTYYTSVSVHYYDIIPFRVYSGDARLLSTDNSLYHFAYQVRR